MTAPRFPRGSEWRKWDMHVHAPGTKLNDCYQQQDGEPDWDQFCQIIHESDVAVVAIADYFSLDGYFTAVEKYQAAYPDDDKLFLPNLELRLNVAVNRADQEVNLHLIFRPTLTREQADKFIGRLNTEGTTGANEGQRNLRRPKHQARLRECDRVARQHRGGHQGNLRPRRQLPT